MVNFLLQINEARKLEMMRAKNDLDKMEVEDKWRNDFRSAIETTMDLLQCVVNDVQIGAGDFTDSVTSRQSSITDSTDLGKIVEEELGRHLMKKKVSKTKVRIAIYIYYTASNHYGLQETRQQLTKMWIENELKKEDDIGWKKDAVSPIIWNDSGSEEADEEAKPHCKTRCKKEVNDAFWDICLSPRRRRISEVLENLSLHDSPDVMQDRCDLLEDSKRRSSTRGRRPPKCYWNIFSEWKHNLIEKTSKRKRYRARPKQRYRRRIQRDSNIQGQKNLTKRFFRPRPRIASSSEGMTMLAEREASSKRRRSDDEMDEGFDSDHSVKRHKSMMNADRTWESIQRESEISFKALTNNLEAKIRAAFRQESVDEELARLACEDEFKDWPEEWASSLNESKCEFAALRDEVRRIRKLRKSQVRNGCDLSIFHEWAWNMSMPDVELSFEELSAEDIFNDWKDLLEQKETSKSTALASKPRRRMAAKLTPDPRLDRAQLQVAHKMKKPKHHHKISKALQTHRKQVHKCFPKQPLPKARSV